MNPPKKTRDAIPDEDVLLEAAQAPSLAALQALLNPIDGHGIDSRQLDRLLSLALAPDIGTRSDLSGNERPLQMLLPSPITSEDASPRTDDHHDMQRRPARLLMLRKVRLLLDAGANPDAPSRYETPNTVLNDAVERGYTASARLLLWRGSKTEGELTSALRCALCEGEWPAIQMLVRHGHSFDECTEDTFWLNDRSAHLLDKIPWTDSRLSRFVRLATEQPDAAQYLLEWAGLSAEHREFLENNPAPTWEEFLESDTTPEELAS